MSKTLTFWFQTIVLIIGPVFLMALSPAFMSIRAYVMGIGVLYLFYVLRIHRATWADLGFTTKDFWPSLKPLILPSLFLILLVLVMLIYLPISLRNSLIGYDPQSIGSIYLRIFLYCIWSVPFQELLFRGYLIWKQKTLNFSHRSIFLISLFVFTLVHIPFKSVLMIIISFYLGVIYIWNYQKYQNIYSLIISHAFVGSVLILIRNFYLPYN